MSCHHAADSCGPGVSCTKRLVIIVSMASFLCAAAPPMQGQESAVAQQPRFDASVDMVIVNVAVFDGSGVPVDGLEAADFTIFDEGEEQEVAVFLSPRAAPLAIVFALDFSESVRPMAPRAREAAATFLSALSADDCVYVLPFQSSVAYGEWVQGADPEIGRRLGMIPFEGGTALYDAIGIGLERLDGVGARVRDSIHDHDVPTAGPTMEVACAGSAGDKASAPGTDRRRALVVLTDGNDQNSVAEYPDILLLTQRAGVPIFPVAIGGAADPYWGARNVGRILSNKRSAVQLEDLARSSGGMMIRANGREGLEPAYAEVLNALRACYVVGYYLPASSAETPGTGNQRHDAAGEEYRSDVAESTGERDRWHDIAVTVSRPGVRVQARPGYLARSPLPLEISLPVEGQSPVESGDRTVQSREATRR